MIKKRPRNYLKCLVIVHGKSELQICNYLKTNFRLKMEIISRDKGESSIQINGLEKLLASDSRLKSRESFIKEYGDDLKLVKQENTKKETIDESFRIFIIMDTDDCTPKTKQKYISKELFRNHWLYPYIVPIYNDPNLEGICEKANIKFKKHGEERKKEYIKIFPTDNRNISDQTVELNDFINHVESINETNIEEFIKFCISNKFVLKD